MAIKEFKQSESWKTVEDMDKELIIVNKFEKIFNNSEYLLKVYDVFRDEGGSRRYIMVTELAKGGVLSELLPLMRS